MARPLLSSRASPKTLGPAELMKKDFVVVVGLIGYLLCACGRDRNGLGEPCGPVTCPVQEKCCNQSCGICTPPGGGCIQLFCTCGLTNCAPGQICCNDILGICTYPGEFCAFAAESNDFHR